MQPVPFKDALIDVLSEIKIVTGVLLYAEKSELKAQAHVLGKFILSSPRYNRMTLTEITHAFYLNVQGVFGDIIPHYNRELNGEYMGNVLNAYLAYKHRFLINKEHDIHLAIKGPDVDRNDAQGWYNDQRWYRWQIQQDYEAYLREGWLAPVYAAEPCYLWLRRNGWIQLTGRGKWLELYKEAVMDYRYRKSQRKAQTTGEIADKRMELEMLDLIMKSGSIPGDHRRVFLSATRRLIYFRFLALMKYFAITDIFQEVQP